MRKALSLAAILAVAAAGFFAVKAHAADSIAVGATAPNFTLPSQEDKPVSLSDYKGKWVVLYFYPKDQTTGCTIEAHNFQRDMAKYDALNAVVLGVSLDTVDSHKGFCTKEGLNFRLLADTDAKVSKAYGSFMTSGDKQYATRNTFLIDPAGVIRKVYLKVDPESHSDSVLADLATLNVLK